MPNYTADFRTDADYATHTFKARLRYVRKTKTISAAAASLK